MSEEIKKKTNEEKYVEDYNSKPQDVCPECGNISRIAILRDDGSVEIIGNHKENCMEFWCPKEYDEWIKTANIDLFDGKYKKVYHSGPLSCSVAGGMTLQIKNKSGENEMLYLPPGWTIEKVNNDVVVNK